jgi:hypothetical protein
MRILMSVAAIAAILLPQPAFAWGKTGHRVIGKIAEPFLTPTARTGIEGILGTETMAEASNWPDFMRADLAPFWQHDAGPWHYVTVPRGKTYDAAGAPPEGDAVTALDKFSRVVRDTRAPLQQRQLALRFIIHIVGDLHQPLHAGNGSDKGGNDVKVTFQGRSTNLHSVWDSALVDEEQLSYSEMAAWLGSRITPDAAARWMVADPKIWIAESAALRDQIYPAGDAAPLSYRYVYENTPRMEMRLEQGGVRLAAYLNALFERTGAH